ncbi:MAG: zf-HC2 domain-containing protein, partial [Polyangiaceae bacterium]|nr:zf-HC2 domain-containing protein [Polyangiaceae bacterium]
MKCDDARPLLLDRQRATLDAAQRVLLEGHLADCAACRHEDAAERELSSALARLPRPAAPPSLKRYLNSKWAPRRARRAAIARSIAAVALGAGLALLAVFVWRRASGDSAIVREAVNDHLRVLYSLRPVEVESSNIHQVKPWFEGRLDFAPTSFAGDDQYPLQGALVGYFVDRKAAVFVYKARLHVMTLFVMRADGMDWPLGAESPSAPASVAMKTMRGFHVLLWRHADL